MTVRPLKCKIKTVPSACTAHEKNFYTRNALEQRSPTLRPAKSTDVW